MCCINRVEFGYVVLIGLDLGVLHRLGLHSGVLRIQGSISCVACWSNTPTSNVLLQHALLLKLSTHCCCREGGFDNVQGVNRR